MLKPVCVIALLLAATVPVSGQDHTRASIPEDQVLPRPDPYLFSLEVLLNRAERMLDRTNRESTKRAAELYRFALQIDSRSAQAHAGRARTLVVQFSRRWDATDALPVQAEEAARKAVEISPEGPGPQAALAYALMALEEWEEAHAAADRAWSLRTEDGPTWIDGIYSQSLLARWERDKALEVATRALERRPDRAALHALRGSILIELRQYPDAIESLQRAYLLEPGFGPALLRLGYAHERMGRHSDAAHLYKKVSDAYPEEKSRAYIMMAATLIGRKNYDSALKGLEGLEVGLERGLGEGTRLFLMALCHEKSGNTARAEELYARVARNHPLASLGSIPSRSAAVAAYEALARIALEQDRLPDAARLLEEALGQKRTTIDLFLQLSRVYREHDLHEEAAGILARGAATDFGPRLAGPKLRILLDWARLLKSTAAPGAAPSTQPPLEALEREVEAILATGNEAWFLDAARVGALLEAPDVGIAWLKRAVALGYRHLDWIRADEEMGSLARHPEFGRLLATPPGS